MGIAQGCGASVTLVAGGEASCRDALENLRPQQRSTEILKPSWHLNPFRVCCRGRSCMRLCAPVCDSPDEQTLQSADLATRRTVVPFPPKRRTAEGKKSTGIDGVQHSPQLQAGSTQPHPEPTSQHLNITIAQHYKR